MILELRRASSLPFIVLLISSAVFARAQARSTTKVAAPGAGASGATSSGPLKLEPHAITLANGKKFTLNLPQGFDVTIAAQGLKRVRFMAKSPDGRIFVTDMYNRADNSRGTVYILDGWDRKSGKFARVVPYLQHLRNPNDVAFYTDPGGQAWLYLPLTDKLERFRFQPGEQSPSSQPEVLATYPDYGLNYKYGGWHLTRTVAFGGKENQGKLYISVGSSCNACVEKEEIRATLSVMDPDGKHAQIIGKGVRNAVGLKFVGSTLYGTNMGADHLGNNAPDDTMFAFVGDGVPAGNVRNYGWPDCYFKAGKIFADPGFASSTDKEECSKVPAPYATFAAHSSPLGLEYFDSTAKRSALKNSFLVALHGSSKKSLKRGYRVVRVQAHAQPQDFITGFLQNGIIYGRPCDVLSMGDDSFLLTDDYAGVIYFVYSKDSAQDATGQR